MAFFKILRGNRSGLNDLAKTDGYVYFCTDDGSLHIDYMDENGSLQRKQITIQDGTGQLNWNGNAWFAGDIRMGGTNYDDASIVCTQDDISGKQNISHDLTIVPDNYGAASISLDGKTQYYYLESVNLDGNFLNLDIFYDNFEKDEFTFYIYLNLSSETPMSFSFNLIKPSEGCIPIEWIETPTIDYPHTKMLLAFKTIDKGTSWVANQCYSMEVTE